MRTRETETEVQTRRVKHSERRGSGRGYCCSVARRGRARYSRCWGLDRNARMVTQSGRRQRLISSSTRKVGCAGAAAIRESAGSAWFPGAPARGVDCYQAVSGTVVRQRPRRRIQRIHRRGAGTAWESGTALSLQLNPFGTEWGGDNFPARQNRSLVCSMCQC